MIEKTIVRCYSPVQAHKALLTQIWPHLKNCLMAGHRMVIEVKPEKRSIAENAMLHALLTRISEQMQWAGAKRDTETWKRLLTAAWCRARNEHIEILPAVDGHGVDIVFRRTSELSRAECAELIEYVLAWAAEHGIGTDRVDPETGEIYT